VAVLLAELGAVTRILRLDQVVAYAGMDIAIKQSGKWRGQAKLSKRGSGLVRRMLSMAATRCIWLPGSAFGVYSHRLLARGVGKMTALMAVMRKMLVIAAYLLRTGEDYDPAPPRLAVLMRFRLALKRGGGRCFTFCLIGFLWPLPEGLTISMASFK